MQKPGLFLCLWVCLFGLATPLSLSAQGITWKDLADVTFEKKWSEQQSAYVLRPLFGAKVKRLENKEVTIRGYIYPIDIANNTFALSAYPSNLNFFVGGAGPETVILLKLRNTLAKPLNRPDMRGTFTGRLRLNYDNDYELTYILEDAVLQPD